MVPNVTPGGYGPTDLRSAYKLTGAAPAGTVIAIIDAYNNPNAESDLKIYRAQFGLPVCTTANGCFRKVNQNGAASPLPPDDDGWAGEIALDLAMVSAVCPTCSIMLVEAQSAALTNLFKAVDRAVTMGAKFVSNSWGADESSGQGSFESHFNHPGVAITASTGDNGYDFGAQYPATSKYVTAVGGTSLRRVSNARGWTESAWARAGSGCSTFTTKPTFQSGTATDCTRRAEADVSAVADPNTGVAVYQTFGATVSGWQIYGGTSASAPIIAGIYALGGLQGPTPNTFLYGHSSALYDITTGSNGSCADRVCDAQPGWDGPTGLGTPNGIAAFVTPPVAVATPAGAVGTVGIAFTKTISATGGTGTFRWTASGLPAGLAISATSGVISGNPKASGTFPVSVTATSGSAAGNAAFTLTVAHAVGATCATTQLMQAPGFENRTSPWWAGSRNVIATNGPVETAHAGTHFALLGGHGAAVSDNVTQSVSIPSGCTASMLSFWLKIDTSETGTAAHDILTVWAGDTAVAQFSNLNVGGYAQRSFNVGAYAGQTIRVSFVSGENASLATSFLVDDTALTTAF